MEEVGDLRHSDLRAGLSRSTAHYRNAILLARHLLAEIGRVPTTGASHTWPFLIRTPENVEKGVRTLLQRLLGQSWDIRKEPITDSTVDLRPDIVINGGYAVGMSSTSCSTASGSEPTSTNPSHTPQGSALTALASLVSPTWERPYLRLPALAISS